LDVGRWALDVSGSSPAEDQDKDLIERLKKAGAYVDFKQYGRFDRKRPAIDDNTIIIFESDNIAVRIVKALYARVKKKRIVARNQSFTDF